MTEIRKATEADNLDVLRMGERAYAAGGHPDTIGPYDPERMQAIVSHLLKDEDGAIFIAKSGDEAVGMVALAMSHVVLSAAYSMAQEITWYVDPDARGKGVGDALLAAALEWAKERGAGHLWMSAPKASQEIAQMCVRRGFRLLESVYIKGV